MTEQASARATLVIGGARSGKSRYAERLVTACGFPRTYIATGAAHDAEMAERIAAHRQQRGDDWRTVEVETALVETLAAEAAPDRVILVDCLTLWLSNLMMAEKDLAAESARLAEAVSGLAGPCVFVSNEIGLGLVPDNRLSRDFRDAQGRLNQIMAAACAQVVFVAAGLPLVLKPNHQPDPSL